MVQIASFGERSPIQLGESINISTILPEVLDNFLKPKEASKIERSAFIIIE
jgi:hypothetical protein